MGGMLFGGGRGNQWQEAMLGRNLESRAGGQAALWGSLAPGRAERGVEGWGPSEANASFSYIFVCVSFYLQ